MRTNVVKEGPTVRQDHIRHQINLGPEWLVEEINLTTFSLRKHSKNLSI